MTTNVRVDERAITEFCRRNHIRRMSLFGSVLGDDFGPQSDIDVLVEFEPGFRPGLCFFDMEEELERLWKRRVDFLTPPFLSPISGTRCWPRRRRSMSRNDPLVPARHMLDFCREAQQLTSTLTRERLESDRIPQLALVRLPELVGEAATRIPQDPRARHTGIPWSGITRFRNRVIHGYDFVDLDIVWAVANDDIPPLIKQLEGLLNAEIAPKGGDDDE